MEHYTLKVSRTRTLHPIDLLSKSYGQDPLEGHIFVPFIQVSQTLIIKQSMCWTLLLTPVGLKDWTRVLCSSVPHTGHTLTNMVSNVVGPWVCGNRVGGLQKVIHMGGFNGTVGFTRDDDAVMIHGKSPGG